jgi:hypothetical protein
MTPINTGNCFRRSSLHTRDLRRTGDHPMMDLLEKLPPTHRAAGAARLPDALVIPSRAGRFPRPWPR